MGETCSNCGAVIGNLQSPFVWKDAVVCGACYGRLRQDEALTAPPPPIDYASTAPPAVPLPPRSAPLPPPAYAPHVQTVEQTGKTWKGQMVASVCCVLVGIILSCAGAGSGAGAGNPITFFAVVLIVGGVGWYIYARVGAWWNHG